MADQDEIINVRIMKGVDLNVNARLADPGTWLSTPNMYAYLRGVLQIRPGSKLIASKITAAAQGQVPILVQPAPTVTSIGLTSSKSSNAVVGTLAGDATGNLTNDGSTPVLVYAFSAGQIVPKKVDGGSTVDKVHQTSTAQTVGQKITPTTQRTQVWTVDSVAGDAKTGGSQPVWPTNPTVDTTTVVDNNVTWRYTGSSIHGGARIAALIQVYYPATAISYWLGAMNTSAGDYLFYIDANNNIVPIPTMTVTSKNAFWRMQTFYRSNGLDLVRDSDLYVICTNGIDAPIQIQAQFTPQNPSPTNPFIAGQPLISTSTGGANYLVGPQDFCTYGNQMVWAGPRIKQNGGNIILHYSNYLLFSDPFAPIAGGVINQPQLASDTTNGAYALQIGDSPAEEVIAVVGSPALTDGFGAQGQLVAWTGYRTMVYNGPVPSSGNPLPPGFGLAAVSEWGTWSPKSVQRTSFGTVYLGSDGLLYIVALDNRIKVIGRALEPLLGGQSRLFYSNVCSYYYKGFYHLFFPDVANSSTNKIEYVADLRYLNLGDPHDAGVLWYGPFIGRWVNCVHVGKHPANGITIYAGLSHKPGVIQLEDSASFSDPNMTNLSGPKVYPTWGAITNPLDLGEAHLDKILKAFSVGVGTSVAASVTATAFAHSDIAGIGAGYSDTKTVNPPAQTLSGSFALDGSVLSDVNNFNLPTFQPRNRLRGRAFSLGFSGTPTTDAFVRLSDLEFRVQPVERRPTDSGQSSV